jgi:hypothetical protein
MNSSPTPTRLRCCVRAALLLGCLLLGGRLTAQVAPSAPTPPPSSNTGDNVPPVASQNVPTPEQVGAQNNPAAPTEPEGTVHMSPFVVDDSKTQGYLSQDTLAGTRLNTNIADLAASITIVTKQQMEDLNEQNINDLFEYEASTEGANTYTPFVLSRSNLQDTLSSGSAITANRVRGLSAPDNEQDNFYSIVGVPFDSYNTQSVEIDRGPNSIIFGTGSPAGIVNQSRTEASLDKFSTEITTQGSSWGGYRETVGLNYPLIPGTLGLYIAQEYQSKGFEQKPSADFTRRQYASITYEPFKNHKTRFTADVDYWYNYANDPNGTTPLDYVTPWLASGRPIWNPLTDQVTYLNTGQTSLPYAESSTYPNYVAGGPLQSQISTTGNANFVSGLQLASNGHWYAMLPSSGGLYSFFFGQQSGLPAGTTPSVSTMTSAQKLVNEERWSESSPLPVPSQYATWYYPSVVSKSIYDWSTINVAAMDYTQNSNIGYHADLQQELLPGLNLDLSMFRQQYESMQYLPARGASVGTLYVDTNSFLPDGQPNPFVGQPFISTIAAANSLLTEINQNTREMLEYSLDLQNKVPAWLSWLGHDRLLFVDTQHDDRHTSLSYQDTIYPGTNTDPNYLPTAATLNAAAGYGYGSSDETERWWYLTPGTGIPNGQGIAGPAKFNSPGYGGPGVYPIQTYNYAASQWQQTQIDFAPLLNTGGGITENLQDSKTYFWQSWFWGDRIVGSVGLDDDQTKNRATVFPTVNPKATEYTNGYANLPLWFDEGPWSYLGGNTSVEGLVFHPFHNWAWVDGPADNGNLLFQTLRTISFTFNRSDNFNPPSAYYTDFFGNPLGKPAGREKDYGFEISTPDHKLFLRWTQFTTRNQNQLVSTTSQGRARYVDSELQNWATAVVEVRNGESPSDPNFGSLTVYPLTQTEENQISALTGLPYGFTTAQGVNGVYINTGDGTEGSVAHGSEIEAEYNPLPNWTMKVTFDRERTFVNGIGGQAAAWLNYRLPLYTKVGAPDLNTVYTKSNGTPMYLGNFWQGYGYDGNVVQGSTSGTSTSQLYYEDIVGSTLAADEASNGGLANNQREYQWRYLTNYTFDRGPIKGLGIGGALRYDGDAVVGYYGNSAILNATGQIAAPNLGLPIYSPAQAHIDAFVSYQMHLPWNDGRVRCKIQFNVNDLTSNGYLIPVSYNWDGSPAGERIIQPRSYALTATFKY